MLKVDLIAALMKIRRSRLRCKRVEAEEVQFLRIDGKRNRSCLLRAEDEVELRVGIETLKFRITRQRWKAVHGCTHEPIFERLRNGDAVLHDRAGKSHPRRRAADTRDGAVAIPQSRYEVLH